jgi:dTDP-4-amino-4,6-dideoxygalactose transaminase
MIPFSVSTLIEGWLTALVKAAIRDGKLSGDGDFTHQVTETLGTLSGQYRTLLTGSCSHALDMAAMLLSLRSGDEVIMPSYTFVSTANAVVLQGATPVFIDIRPETMNIDERLIESAITPKTKAIFVMHYGGVACAMDDIMAIAARHNLAVVEDAAQAIDAYYLGSNGTRHLGTIGSFGTLSFHDTKNITSGGEGGALFVNDASYWERARIIREKGTNRSQFYEGIVDKYTWVDVGSSYLMAELNAAFLLPQLEQIDDITRQRRNVWQQYSDAFVSWADRGIIELQTIPDYAKPNGHLFYLKMRDTVQRNALIQHLRSHGITAPFHYIPLHSSPAGQKFGRFHGEDRYTSRDSARLIRLPVFHGITAEQVQMVIEKVEEFLGATND